jgi:hypothetical protein
MARLQAALLRVRGSQAKATRVRAMSQPERDLAVWNVSILGWEDMGHDHWYDSVLSMFVVGWPGNGPQESIAQ